MSKSARKIIGAAAPLAGLIPGVGLPLAIGLGAGGGLLAGGGLKGAITGGLGGALTGGGAGLLGNAVNSGLDLGLTGAQATGIGGGLLGAGAGGASGGLKGALTGGVLGGAGSYLANGGISELGNGLGLTGEGSVLGTTAGTPVANGFGPTQGSGILGSATRGLSDIGSALSVGTGGGGSAYGGGGSSGSSGMNIAGALLGGANSLNANDDAQKALMEAQKNALGQLNPYLVSGGAANSRLSELLGTSGNSGADGYGSLTDPFTPGDLTQDPGYQFQLEQGNQALDRQQAAKGGYFSGAALKAAQDYGQGLADTTYKDAYARDAANKAQQYGMFAGQSGAGQTAAGSASDLYQGIGNAKAGAGISSANIVNQTLSSLLSGSGAKRPVNIGGQVVYV